MLSHVEHPSADDDYMCCSSTVNLNLNFVKQLNRKPLNRLPLNLSSVLSHPLITVRKSTGEDCVI